MHHPPAGEVEVIGIIVLCHVEMHVDIGIDYLRILHIAEESGVDMEVLCVFAVGLLGEVDFILREFSHSEKQLVKAGRVGVQELRGGGYAG